MSTLAATTRPGALLLVADFHGTLASVRSLGRAGVDVTVADWRRLVPARWSRWAARSVTCPDPQQPRAFMRWLLELGEREPGLVLMPTTDDLAWLFARHRDVLHARFTLDAPPLDAVYAVLNKWRLREACEAVGIATPETWLPDEGAAGLDTDRYHFPLLIKPQTQTLLTPHQKGRVVRRRDQLKALYADFRRATRHAGALLELDPSVSRPMLQALVPSRGIYGLSGFIDDTGELFVAAAARKVLQRPHVLGIGLCFQQAEIDWGLAERLRALCRHVKYHGVFEVEFIEDPEHPGKHLLIDFNPRCYGQMGFDIARGADLPLMAYLQAIGDRSGLEAVVTAARHRLHGGETHAWCDRISLEAFMRLRRLTGAIGHDAARAWSEWLSVHERHLTDAVIDRDDLLPAIVAGLSTMWGHLSHPRATWRAIREG